jgi:hypothetical protein
MGRPAIILAAGAGLLLGLMAAGLAAEDPAPAPKPAPAPAMTPEERAAKVKEASAARLQKAVENLEKQLGGVREYETKLSSDVTAALSKAGIGGKNAKGGGKFDQAFTKDDYPPELLEARNIGIACARKLIELDGRYAACAAAAVSLQNMAERTHDEAPKASVQQVADSIWQGRRANLERIAGIFGAVGDYRDAAAIYIKIAQIMPKDKRNDADLGTLKQAVQDLQTRQAKILEDRRKYKQEQMAKNNSSNSHNVRRSGG